MGITRIPRIPAARDFVMVTCADAVAPRGAMQREGRFGLMILF